MFGRLNPYSSALLLALSVTHAGAAPDPASSEYLNQHYLQGINVLPAWEAGLFGGGIVVADLDSGVRASHIDLVGKIAEGGYDFINDDDDPFDDERTLTKGHGTSTAAIVVGNWNGVGVGGIAPNAKILPVKIANDTLETNSGLITQGVSYAASRPEVRIIMIEVVNDSTSPEEWVALQRAVLAGKLILAPAGNKGQASPFYPAATFAGLGSSAMVVGSSNKAGGRSKFSNGALGVENNYIMAPGEMMLAAGNQADDFYYEVEGTSMAVPQVAAAAALIWSYAPQLTASQVAEILKETATDLGAAGVDSINGFGTLNIEKALAPIGAIKVPTEEESPDESTEEEEETSTEVGDGNNGGQSGQSNSSGGSGGGAGLALAALVVGGAGYALVRNYPDLDETLILDEYGRTYELDLETRVSVRNPGPSAKSVLQELDTQQTQDTLIQRSDLTIVASYTGTNTSYFSGSRPDPFDSEESKVSMRLDGSDNDSVYYALGVNQAINFFPTDLRDNEHASALASTFRADAFGTPFLGFSDTGYHGAVGFAPETGWRSGLEFAAINDQRKHGLKSETSSLDFGFREKRYGLGVQIGLMEEDGNLLGGASEGALSVSAADTWFGALRANLNLTRDWSIVGRYTHGMTWAKDAANSMVGDFSRIESNSWGLGVLGKNLFDSGDAFGLAIAQPLRTIDGDAQVSVPYWNYSSGRIDFKKGRASLVPDGTETNFEVFYRKPIDRHLRFVSYFVHRSQPLHQKGLATQTSLIGALSGTFGVPTR